ncbi:MAG: CHASE2 domain-containing protein [Ferruginibacter sp.]
MAKKIMLSLLSGLVILVITWKYQNYDYSLALEDNFIKKMFMFKDNIYAAPSKAKAEFVFINTGKDLALVEDTIEYGNVAVSDREKIYRFISYLNSLNEKPLFNVIDIQFYFPFTKDLQVDSLLQAELAKNDNTLIPILKMPGGDYKAPLYKARYAYSNYRTFGPVFNKFRVMNEDEIPSIPRILHQSISKAVYRDHFFFPTCNGRPCLSALWPDYYLRDRDIRGVNYETDGQRIKKNDPRPAQGNIKTQYYNIGEILFDLDAGKEKYNKFFGDKIVIIGNFEDDIHVTPVGKMAGPVLLANIYLSLLNGEHIISYWLVVVLILAFSVLSYIALFRKMPEIKLKFDFLFSSFVNKFIKGYISYFGCMFLLSLLVLLIFNNQVALFLPSLIFTGIEYMRQKKYKSKPAEGTPVTRKQL